MAESFISLGVEEVIYLILLGLFGGMLSGFIGSGGAFVLTPGMMAIGTPGVVAVASNMCHKFPKAMIGAWRRARVGHLDLRLAALMATSAIVGVQAGIYVQGMIAAALGPAGTDLYVSAAFLIVLPVVASLSIRDVIIARKYGLQDIEPEFARKLANKFTVPPMINFRVAGTTQSLWLTLPTGFATGFLAATIAVGGFIGVPSMIYIIGAPAFVASGTELGVAFVMGSTGTFTWAYTVGAVDFRMTALILAGSLIGVQIGAVGTTYVKEYFIKLAMAVVILWVVLSRAFAVPEILFRLGWISLNEASIPVLEQLVFWTMVAAMVSVTPIVLIPMIRLRIQLARAGLSERALGAGNTTSTPGSHKRKWALGAAVTGCITVVSYVLLFMYADAWTEFATLRTIIAALAVVAIALYFAIVHGSFAHYLLDWVKIRPVTNREVVDELRTGNTGASRRKG